MKRSFTREELSKMIPIKPVSQLAIDTSKINRPLSEQILTPVKNTCPVKQAITTKPIITGAEQEVIKKPFIEPVTNKLIHTESATNDYTELFKKQKEAELAQEQVTIEKQDVKQKSLDIENQRLKSALEEKDLLLSDKNSLIVRLQEANKLLAEQVFKPVSSFNHINELIESEKERENSESETNLNNPVVMSNLTVDTIESDFVYYYNAEGILTAVPQSSNLIGELQESESIE